MQLSERNRSRLVLGVSVGAATALKLWLALTTFGTNDVRYWKTFMDHVVGRGSVSIYRDIPIYNHPPMMSGLLWLIHLVAGPVPNAFPFLIRLPAICADVASAILVYRLVRFGWGDRRALVCGVGVALSPILVMVSGFHGNTDPVFMALVLLAAERLILGGSPVGAGVALGLAINVKLVPLILLPVFFFHLPFWPARRRFAAAALAAIVVGFGYHFVAAYPFLKRNVFDYSGLKGIWGLTFFIKGGFPSITSAAWVDGLKVLIGLIVVVRAIVAARTGHAVREPAAQARALLRSIGEAFFVFLLLTPGFGIQYLSWFAIAAYLMSLAGAVGYNVLGGIFMFSVYHYWNGGFPWNIADSDRVGPWRAPQALFGQATWIYLVAWLAIMIHARVTAARALPGTTAGSRTP